MNLEAVKAEMLRDELAATERRLQSLEDRIRKAIEDFKRGGVGEACFTSSRECAMHLDTDRKSVV